MVVVIFAKTNSHVGEKMYVVGIATFCVLNVNDVTPIALIFKKIFVLS